MNSFFLLFLSREGKIIKEYRRWLLVVSLPKTRTPEEDKS